jgi:hypothetical protein
MTGPNLAMTGPNPLRWIWYTLGGKLGSPYREWVLHDTTRRLRQILSFMDLIVLPTAVVLAVLGVSWIVWAGVGLGLLLALAYSRAYITSNAERRLVKLGYKPGTLSGRSGSATTWMRSCAPYRPIGPLPSSASPNPLL